MWIMFCAYFIQGVFLSSSPELFLSFKNGRGTISKSVGGTKDIKIPVYNGVFKKEKEIGHGSNSKVILGLMGDMRMAAKIPNKKGHGGYVQEALMQSFAACQNVVPVIGLCKKKKKMYFLLPYYKRGTLLDRMLKGRISEERAKSYMMQLALAVEWMHKKNIFHSDISDTNVFISDDAREVLLGDFGNASAPERGIGKDMSDKDILGEKRPIEFQDVRYLRVKDYVGLGKIAYSLFSGLRWNNAVNARERAQMILSNRSADMDLDWPSDISQKAREFIKGFFSLKVLDFGIGRFVSEDPWLYE
eukprot:GHVN01007156.1.p2 GENE.GHVN01007156.1~~GHVN01007156.1.p2  ORF type:complete len:303 (+),score=22.21 GHVN01007156.1:1138-2046(+)